MGNALRIFLSDVKRLSTNVVAIVIIIGLAVIPCLYAWFNILSNWDPYGPDATKNLQIAVASADEGMKAQGIEINIGDKIVSNLKENSSIGWVFTDNAQEAIDGVHSGDYYACLVIDESFTEDMVSFLGGNIKNPKIDYYENEKKNAIAPKITSKVKTTVAQEVNSAFVGTLAKFLASTGDQFVSIDAEGNLKSAAVDKLYALNDDLTSYILILDSYVSLMRSANSLMDTAQAVADEALALMDAAQSVATSADAAADAAEQATRSMSDIIRRSINTSSKNLDGAAKVLEDTLTKAGVVGEVTVSVAKNQILPVVATEQRNFLNLYYTDENGDGIPETIKPVFENRKAEIDKIALDYASLMADLERLVAYGDYFNEDVKALTNTVNNDLKACQDDLEFLQEEYEDNVYPQLNATMDSVTASINEIQAILGYDVSSIDKVVAALQTYPVSGESSEDSLEQSKQDAIKMQESLQELIKAVEGVSDNEQYEMFVSLVETDPGLISDFISSPVSINQINMFEIANNGSASAPFYVVLSIWVGSLIMSTLLKTPLKNKDGYKNLKNWQIFLGRYGVTFFVGQIQTFITAIGCILYVDIQCEHPFLFWVACAWTSAVYSLLLYSFSYSFGNAGQAVSVILMVIQVAGSGGTFPIEVLPRAFQIFYKFMPFNYSMNALRECVGGFYGFSYLYNILMLIPFAIAAVVIGVVLYFAFRRLIGKMNESKEKSGLLI